MKYVKIVLTLLLCSSTFLGDYVVFKSKFASSQVFRAFADSVVHATIGFLSSLVFFGHETSVSGYVKLYYVIICSIISSLIDIDHVFVAKSFELKALTSLKQRGIFHCTSFWFIISTVLLIYSHTYKKPDLYILTWILILAYTSHHVRDANRRGLWLYPYGHTPALSKYVVVKKCQRGPYLKIIFSFKSNGCHDSNGYTIEATESDEFDIDELAKIKFSFKYLTVLNGSHMVSMTSVKQEIDCLVKMKVMCKTLEYSKEIVCSDDWLNWSQIGSHRGLNPVQAGQQQNYNSSQKSKDVTTFTEIIIFVYEWTRIGFETFYDDLDLTDFALEAADGSVFVHKVCLAAHCDAFRNMMTGPWVEAKKDCIQIKDVRKETLEDLKVFIYLGGLPETARLRNLLVLACQYFMDRLKEECIRKLVFTVSPEELNSLHTLAGMYNIPELSVAISQWTPDEVIDKAYEIEKKREQTEEK